MLISPTKRHFKKPYTFSIKHCKNLCDEVIFLVKPKTKSNFTLKFVSKKEALYFWLFGESNCLNICPLWNETKAFVELNCLCKQFIGFPPRMKRYRRSQPEVFYTDTVMNYFTHDKVPYRVINSRKLEIGDLQLY